MFECGVSDEGSIYIDDKYKLENIRYMGVQTKVKSKIASQNVDVDISWSDVVDDIKLKYFGLYFHSLRVTTMDDKKIVCYKEVASFYQPTRDRLMCGSYKDRIVILCDTYCDCVLYKLDTNGAVKLTRTLERIYRHLYCYPEFGIVIACEVYREGYETSATVYRIDPEELKLVELSYRTLKSSQGYQLQGYFVLYNNTNKKIFVYDVKNATWYKQDLKHGGYPVFSLNDDPNNVNKYRNSIVFFNSQESQYYISSVDDLSQYRKLDWGQQKHQEIIYHHQFGTFAFPFKKIEADGSASECSDLVKNVCNNKEIIMPASPVTIETTINILTLFLVRDVSKLIADYLFINFKLFMTC